MKNFSVPAKAEVSETHQQIFDNLEKGLGMMPNLYAYFVKNDTALTDLEIPLGLTTRFCII